MKSGRLLYSAYLIRVARRGRAWARLVESVRPDPVRLAGKLARSNRETVFLQWCRELLSGHKTLWGESASHRRLMGTWLCRCRPTLAVPKHDPLRQPVCCAGSNVRNRSWPRVRRIGAASSDAVTLTCWKPQDSLLVRERPSRQGDRSLAAARLRRLSPELSASEASLQ